MAARPDTWMPLYWGDYARDTGHLNNAGHGAYLMLIKHYWCTGQPIPDDDDELWRIACCDSKRDWRKLRPKIERFFEVRDGFFHHKRVDAELAKASAITERKAEAGRLGAKKRWPKNGSAMAQPSDCQSQTDAHSPSPSHSSPSSVLSDDKTSEGADAPANLEKELFDRGKAVLGKDAGGLIAKLLKAKDGSVPLARAAIETASTKQDAREFIGAIVRSNSAENDVDGVVKVGI